MASNKDIRRGLEIFARYMSEDEDTVEFDPEFIYVGPPGITKELFLPAEDIKELEDLGWRIDPSLHCWRHF